MIILLCYDTFSVLLNIGVITMTVGYSIITDKAIKAAIPLTGGITSIVALLVWGCTYVLPKGLYYNSKGKLNALITDFVVSSSLTFASGVMSITLFTLYATAYEMLPN